MTTAEGCYKPWYIRLLEAHPNCSWKVRPATDGERDTDNGQDIDFILELEGADMHLTTEEAIDLIQWSSP